MAMKESGIEWVGSIPDTWDVIPNKYIMHKEKNLCEKWTGEDVMSLTMNGVHIPQELRIRSRGTERHSASN